MPDGPPSKTRWGSWTTDPYYRSPVWRQLRAMALNRDRFRCRICRRYAEAVDHIIPKSQGGVRDDLRNLQSLCLAHHQAKTAQERRTAR